MSIISYYISKYSYLPTGYGNDISIMSYILPYLANDYILTFLYLCLIKNEKPIKL